MLLKSGRSIGLVRWFWSSKDLFFFKKVNIFSVIQKTKTNPPDYDISDANVKPEKLL